MNNQSVIVDSGSAFTKAGFSGYECPKSCFPTIIGRTKLSNIMNESGKDYYLGEDAELKSDLLQINSPIKNGNIEDWDDMERIWKYTFENQLNIETNEYKILISDYAMSSKINRQKIVQYMFENFNASGCYLSAQAQLALYASGRTTGLVIDIGHGITQVVPVFEGFYLRNEVEKIPFAGDVLNNKMKQLLQESGLSNNLKLQHIKAIKEKLCYVALDPGQQNFQTKKYELPDGNILELKEELFRCPEALFNPKKELKKDQKGIQELVTYVIGNCNIDIRKILFSSIILSGGSTCFQNFGERLQNELVKIVPTVVKPSVFSDENRQNMVWLGGSIISSLPNFSSSWISTEEYSENGPSIVDRKCI